MVVPYCHVGCALVLKNPGHGFLRSAYTWLFNRALTFPSQGAVAHEPLRLSVPLFQ